MFEKAVNLNNGTIILHKDVEIHGRPLYTRLTPIAFAIRQLIYLMQFPGATIWPVEIMAKPAA